MKKYFYFQLSFVIRRLPSVGSCEKLCSLCFFLKSDETMRFNLDLIEYYWNIYLFNTTINMKCTKKAIKPQAIRY